MKSIIASVVGLCLCLASAQPLAVPAQLEAQLQSVVDEMAPLGESAAKALLHQYEEIVVEEQQQLDEAMEQLEARRAESAACVAAQDEQIARAVDAGHQQLPARDSAEIVSDINQASQQLIFGGYALRQSCMAKFYVQASVYLISARSSLKTITQSTSDRIPAVFVQGSSCTCVGSGKAVQALHGIRADIDSCIGSESLNIN